MAPASDTDTDSNLPSKKRSRTDIEREETKHDATLANEPEGTVGAE